MKQWYAGLANDVVRRRRIFAPIGSFHRSVQFEDDICSALADAGFQPRKISVDHLATEAPSADLGSNVVVVVLDFERALRFSHPENQLRHCRPNLQQAGEAGAAWLIISRTPESRYPLVDGSSITIDSARHRMRPLPDDELRSSLATMSAQDAKRIAQFSGGSRAIAGRLIELLEREVSRQEEIAEAKRIILQALIGALEELGPELLASLERWVFEYGATQISTADIRNDDLLELRGSGVAEIDLAGEHVSLFPAPHTVAWRQALNIALSDQLEAPDQWGAVVADLFFIERYLRRAIVRLLEDRHGANWRPRLPADMQERIISTFSRDVARVDSIDKVERPLDWVTLGDIFELISKLSGVGQLEGLNISDWRTIGDTILPVRNRVSHMRLLRDGDRQAVRSALWRINNSTKRT